ncbi:MAG: hypothetical protein K9N10_21880 [Deltaproteobacteria bacterium]|nr:hypothetical protein [Deltaproteobacteria bacterium]
MIDTVERIQGQERDVVVVSLTASDEEHIKAEKDFLMMPNRMNVSFTRPRTKLIVDECDEEGRLAGFMARLVFRIDLAGHQGPGKANFHCTKQSLTSPLGKIQDTVLKYTFTIYVEKFTETDNQDVREKWQKHSTLFKLLRNSWTMRQKNWDWITPHMNSCVGPCRS